MSFYLLHRGWMDNPIFSNEPFTEKMAWVWMIQEASFEPHKVRYHSRMIEVSRGQIPTSYRKLKEIFQWGNERIRRFLTLLVNEAMIVLETGTGFLIITICNYEKYQKPARTSGTQPGTVVGTQSGTNPGTNIKKGKELKEEVSSEFENFFEKFPPQRKGSKKNILPAWQAALNRATEKEILDGLDTYLASASVRDGFAKGAAAWLNDDGWKYQSVMPSNQNKPIPKQTRAGAITL